jgi:hypothetical protein
MKILRNLTVMAAVAAALTIAAQARANQISFFLLQQECPGDNCISSPNNVPALFTPATAPYQVTVTTQSATQATLTISTINGTASIADPVFINVNGTLANVNGGTNATLDSFVYGNGNVNNTVGGITGSGSPDQFGTFDHGTGAVGPYTTITFNLVLASGSWTDAANVLKLTTGFNSLYNTKNGDPGFEVATEGGVQDAGWFTPTPLPAALPLFATGIGGLGLLGWRRKRKAQAVA